MILYYLIDSADFSQIDETLSMGVCGVTANTTMYRRHKVSISTFVQHYADRKLDFFSGEVIGSYEEMCSQAEALLALRHDLIIKINFSKDGLRLAYELHKKGVKTAMTLIFTVSQAVAAINAGCDYLFFFIGRNEEQGNDGMKRIHAVQSMIDAKGYSCKVVAASIKNLYQLETLAEHQIDYAAIPYDLYIKSLNHPLTTQGEETFLQDYKENPAYQ